MSIDPDELRRAILEVVQPLYRGRFDSKTDPFSRLIEIPQFDDFDQFLDAGTPFGIANSPTPNTLAYYLHMGGDALAPIIIAQQHTARPAPGPKGQFATYSTDATGKTIKTKITHKNNGDLEIESIDGSIKLLILANGTVLIGSAASGEPLVLGTAFTTLYNAHTHVGNLGVPTGGPVVPMGPTEVSAKSFTEI